MVCFWLRAEPKALPSAACVHKRQCGIALGLGAELAPYQLGEAVSAPFIGDIIHDFPDIRMSEVIKLTAQQLYCRCHFPVQCKLDGGRARVGVLFADGVWDFHLVRSWR